MHDETVAQTDTSTTTAESQQQIEDPPISRFTWAIENFSRVNAKKLYSEIFVVGGYKWYGHLGYLFPPSPNTLFWIESRRR